MDHQYFSKIGEHYRTKGCYSAYMDTERTVKCRNFDSKVRLLSKDPEFTSMLQVDASTKLGLRQPLWKVISGSLAFETLFYLPNRFQQILIINHATVEAKSTEESLLSMMNKLFGVGRDVAAEGGRAQYALD